MRNNLLKGSVILTVMFTLLTTTVFGDDGSMMAEKYGIITLLPPAIAIILAFITKDVIISLFIGVLTGAFLVSIVSTDFVHAIMNTFHDVINRVLTSLADPWNAGIILQVLTIGGVIALITKMGGAKAVAEGLSKKAKGPVSAQIITWLLGLCVFFDDYANSLIIGPIMRPVTDKMKVSREKLAFIIDSTAAPISGMAIISTWIGYELSLIKDAFSTTLGTEVDAFGLFIETIPYRFYNILILGFIVFTVLMKREYGPMYKAEVMCREGGDNNINEIKMSAEQEEVEPKEGIKLSIWNAIIPVGVLIISAFIFFYTSGKGIILAGEDKVLIDVMNNSPYSFLAIREAFGAADASIVLFQSALLATIVAMIMGVCQKIFTFTEAVDTWVGGMKPLIITGVILLLAWSLSGVIKDLGTAKYLVSILSDRLPGFLLPSIIFILGAIMSFATGTAYGTMGILMPLTIPLAHALGSGDETLIIISASAVMTGAIFGDHCSPISDTTILSSMGAGCDHLKHVRTQMPYALTVAAITIFAGYIPVGLGVSVWIVLPVALTLTALAVRFIGKPVADAKAY